MGPPYGKLPILFPSGGPIITLVDSFLVPQVLVAAPRFLTLQGPGVRKHPGNTTVFGKKRYPMQSMYGIFTCILLIYLVDVGRYFIHRYYGYDKSQIKATSHNIYTYLKMKSVNNIIGNKL